ncbi:hypothetical protein HLK66_26170 (plasmid) [Niallia circulans]|uniref:hypothetical protein n=1 Tax=Niallia TaxID=2837506 RepID=UPI0014906392|nr:hypothetical protein [Niallia circulans]QJX65167.1 hypothetical protein HLK66_26170 [Niallia circulans]
MSVKETLSSLRIQSTTISFLGLSFELGLKEKKKFGTVHLKELYKIRYILSVFYFSYQQKYKRSVIEEDQDLSFLLIDLHEYAVHTYKKLALELFSSEFFILLDSSVRDRIIGSFDYVNITESFMNDHQDNELNAEEVKPIINELLNLFEETSQLIEELQREID